MSDMIQDRNETISMLATLMQDINTMTGDIKDQTQLQGEKLETIDDEIGGAADNVEQANEQLEEKMVRENKGNKCLTWCVVIAILVVIVLIFFTFIKKDKEIVIEYRDLPEDQQQ